MNQMIVTSLTNGVGVFVGLMILWSIVRFGTLEQRALNAAFAAGASAVATFCISAAIASA